MPLYLKDPEVDRLARELARVEGATLTEAVARAIRERLERIADAKAARRARVEAGLAKLRAMPFLDARDPDEILYDEHGLPKA
jgi:antitoxin VapB